jgi:hypothetical protein
VYKKCLLDNCTRARRLIGIITEDRLGLRTELLAKLERQEMFLRRELPGHLTDDDATPFCGHSYSHAFNEGDRPRDDPAEEEYCNDCMGTELWRLSMEKAIREMTPLPADHPDTAASLLEYFREDIVADFKTYIAHVVRKTHENKVEGKTIDKLNKFTVLIRCDW